ncbi:MAG: transglutaminase domain-containing protein [Nocardioidaceae bacterium]|nr:transglutaminase domain-containing protein [Nocardioidaceae bacterium]
MERHKMAGLGWVTTVATSLSFYPALADKRFVFIGAVLAASLVGAGAVLRQVRAPWHVVLGVQLLLLFELLAIGYGGRLKYHVLPTEATFDRVERVLRAGAETAQEYAAPAPESAGLTLMVVFFIALVAIGVDLLAVGLGRVPLAGLPLLALYTVPVAALPKGIPVYAFVPGAIGYIAMLTTAERDRLVHWGRLVSRSEAPWGVGDGIDTSGLTSTGRKVTFLALSAAVVLPFVIPAFAPSILDGGRQPGRGVGNGGTLTFDDPMVSLAQSLKRSDPVDVLVVQSDDRPEYLRLAVLYEPGPDAWRTRPINLAETLRLDQDLPAPVGLLPAVGGEDRNLVISPTSNFPSDSAWLPVPFASRLVQAGDDWMFVSADQTVTGASESSEPPTDYSVEYRTVEPTTEQLRSADAAPEDITDRYAQVPADVPSAIGVTARAVVSGAANDYEAGVLLQDFFRDSDNFSYDLDVGYGYGYDAMVKFLDKRRGFCQQFAATMAMMAREVGIPSRIVVGFLKPERLEGTGHSVFTSDNVHSWPELYFEGVGWVRFEPTPGVGAPLPAYAPRPSVDDLGGPRPSTPTATAPDDRIRPSLDPETGDASVAPDSGSSGSGSGGAIPSTRWLMVLAALLALAVPGLLRRAIRRHRLIEPNEGASAAEAAWLELRDTMLDLGLPWTGSMTPRARGRSIQRFLYEDPDGLSALNRLTSCVERARYASSLPADAHPGEDVRTVVSALTRVAARGRRIRAALIPASLLPDLRAQTEQLREKGAIRRLRPARDWAARGGTQ